MALPTHVFPVGRSVLLLRGRMDVPVSPGPYVVLRHLPNDDPDRQYRVRHADGHERVVTESRLRGA